LILIPPRIYRSREIAGREDERIRRQGRETEKTVTAVDWRKRKDKKEGRE
jgi:hypothetical protein